MTTQPSGNLGRMPSPGPPQLGRGLVLMSGQNAPDAWSRCQRVVVGEAEVADPRSVVETLHTTWMERRPVVIELAADPASLRAPECCTAPVYGLSPEFEFVRERLQHLVWANNYDARSGEIVWWHGRRAARRFAHMGVVEGGPADVVLAGETPLFVDGGPFAPPAPIAGTAVVHRWNVEAGSLAPVGDGVPGAELAPDQLAAVRHRAGGARVIAPAGSGKTRVLTERLRHLVADRRVHPGVVTALAFNTKAAEEMRRRCDDLRGPEGPNIRTLNSVGLWICNQFGRSGQLRTIDETEVRDLLQRLFDIRRQMNTDTVLPYIDALSAIRLGLTAPKTAEEAFPDAVGIAAGFDRYRSALADAVMLDFDEQVYRAIEILVTDPDARAAAQASCRLLLVDEFQDLNPAHMLLVRLLSAPTYNCFGVGDDDQVIYGYSGATPKFLIDFLAYFPGAGHHALEVNYRCPAAIVSAAAHLLSYNCDRLTKTMRTTDGRVEAPLPLAGPLQDAGSLQVLSEPSASLTGLAIKVVETWRGAGVAWQQMVVLARVNSALLPVQLACVEAGIPCNMPLDAKVLNRTGIRTALAYLRIGLSPESIPVEDLAQTVRRPSRGIARNVVEMLTKRSRSSVTDVRRLAGRLSGGDAGKLRSYAEDLEAVAEACRGSTASALSVIRQQVGLGETMDTLDTSRREADRSTHADDLLALESVAALHRDPATFEPWLRDLLRRASAQGELVQLSTIHRMKGREWDHVVIFGASEGLIPHRLSDDEEGERRVFHVAITRARRQVVILADAQAPSEFLAELDGRRPRSGTPRRRHRRDGVAPVGPVLSVLAGDRRAKDRPTARRARGRSSTGRQRVEPTIARPEPERIPSPVGPAETVLRAWRSETARRDKVPAYVVLQDAELSGIATRCPATLAELAACRGMGPIRLERYGDEILAVLAGASGGSPGGGVQVEPTTTS